jgi:hypothetical protein
MGVNPWANSSYLQKGGSPQTNHRRETHSREKIEKNVTWRKKI